MADPARPFWKSSPITVGLERLFRTLAALSIANRRYGTRVDVNSIEDDEEHRRTTHLRVRWVDLVALAHLVILAVLVALTALEDSWPRWPILLFCVYRIVDIVQSTLNIALFDALRLGRRRHSVASAERVVLLLLLNYIEIVILFGAVYATLNGVVRNSSGWHDAYYLSLMTQATVGYGDVAPQHVGKIIASTQTLLGVLLVVIILSRMVALLSPITSDDADPRHDAAT